VAGVALSQVAQPGEIGVQEHPVDADVPDTEQERRESASSS
jgi:hypothetical protein